MHLKQWIASFKFIVTIHWGGETHWRAMSSSLFMSLCSFTGALGGVLWRLAPPHLQDNTHIQKAQAPNTPESRKTRHCILDKWFPLHIKQRYASCNRRIVLRGFLGLNSCIGGYSAQYKEIQARALGSWFPVLRVRGGEGIVWNELSNARWQTHISPGWLKTLLLSVSILL